MDKYSVLDLIGEGSFGRVFRGKDKQTGEIVALKLIPKVGHSDKDIKSLRCECKIQKELQHPNIVKMIDAFETDNEVISVAEYVPGELFRLFDQYKAEVVGQRRLPEYRVKELAGDLVSALHYLHRNRILHRDIKPQNILLDTEGRAKLCDFGFARNLGLNTMVLTSIKGTPLYMAPELIEEKPYDHTADIWSLGCIIYELLVGVPPFSTSSLFQLIKKIRYESVQWPSHLSAVARDWLQGTLEKDCRRRLSWPDLHNHPFVKDYVSIQGNIPGAVNALPPLTDTLSASQELAKEIQRQDKAKLLPGGSKTLIKVAQKHEIQKQQLAAAQNSLFSRKPGLPGSKLLEKRRFSDGSHLKVGSGDVGVGNGNGMLMGRHYASHMSRRMSEFGQQLSMMPHLAQAQYIAPVQPLQPHSKQQSPIKPFQRTTSNLYVPPKVEQKYNAYNINLNIPFQNKNQTQIIKQMYNANQSNVRPPIPSVTQFGSSQQSMSTSSSLGPPPLQFTQSIQQSGLVIPEPIRNNSHIEMAAVVEKLNSITTNDAANISADSNETLKNEDEEENILMKPEESLLENDEWCEFLDGQLSEIMDELDADGNLDCIDNTNFLGMIIGPLKNKNANPLLLQKIANILILPLILDKTKFATVYANLLNSYRNKNLINLLLLSIKISQNKDITEIDQEQIEEYEIAWALLLSLVSHLIHSEEFFVKQISHLDSDLFITLVESDSNEIILDSLSILNKLISCRKDLDDKFVKNIYQGVTNELLHEEVSGKIILKICYLLGLIARNYPSCTENKNLILKKISHCIKEESGDTNNAFKFCKKFME